MENYAKAINKFTDLDPEWVKWDYETLVIENLHEKIIDPSRLIFIHQFGQVVYRFLDPFHSFGSINKISIFEIEVSAFSYAVDALSFNLVTVGMLDIKSPVPLFFALRLMDKLAPVVFSDEIIWYIATCLVANGIQIFPAGIIGKYDTKYINQNIINIAKDKASEDAMCMSKLMSGEIKNPTDREKECIRNLELIKATVQSADNFWSKIEKSIEKIKKKLEESE